MVSTLLVQPGPLALLRYWDEARHGRELPEWEDDVSRLPLQLLPNIAVTERRPESVFRYVGSESLRRWGAGITGAVVYDEVATGSIGRYLRSLGDDAVHNRKPVFSAAVLQADGASARLRVGRLYAPFSYRGASEPRVIVGLQIFPPGDDGVIDLRRARLLDEDTRCLVASPHIAVSAAEAAMARGGAPAAGAALERLIGSALVRLALQQPG